MALSQPRNTQRREDELYSLPMAGGAKIYRGALVVRNGSGNAEPGKEATGLQGVGVARDSRDNSAGADGDLDVTYEKGVFAFVNSGADPVARADIGNTVYVVDDETIAKTDGGGTRSPAGPLRDLDDQGRAWVAL